MALSLSGKGLATIYTSIACTYSDLQNYPKALEFYYRELETRHGDLKEVSNKIINTDSIVIIFLSLIDLKLRLHKVGSKYKFCT